MNEIRRLWNNKSNPKGRVDITFFFINIFLIFCHTILMTIYVIAGYKTMIYVNIISILIYISQFYSCYKKPKIYILLTFIEIWLHMILAILAFGWPSGFQNWTFALIAAYFLPTYSFNNIKKSKLQSVIFSLILMTTYFASSVIIHEANLQPFFQLSNRLTGILFTFNNLFSFTGVTMFALFYTDSSKRKESELTKKADYDELTDLYNRHAIIRISRTMTNPKGTKKKYNAAILDIDFFKKVNDEYGHNSGDIVLKEIANILKEHNKNLIPARWGGEEFVILSTTDVTFTEFKKLMESLRIKISKHKFKIVDKKEINITISIGITKVKKDEILNDAIKVADKNLYKAKKAGRNRVIS